MKPDFALSLSMEGITFMCRAEDGWHLLGDVPLDHRDLGGALAELRAEGEALVEGDALCKLILPNDQIKFLNVYATEADAEEQVAAALEGATPYAVSELSYDFTEIDEVFQVAAVAMDTLREAEAFAVEHGFAPVSFVAIPDGDEFDGEPFFGATASAGQFLAADEYPEPDLDPVDITGAGAPIDFHPAYSTPVVLEDAPSFSSRRSPAPEPEPAVAPVAASVAAPDVPEPTPAPVAPPPPASTLSEQSPRIDPAALAAGLKAYPKGAMTPALEVVNPAPPIRPQSYVGVTTQPMSALPRHRMVALYLIAFFVVILAAAVTWAALFTEDGVASLWKRSDVTQIAMDPQDGAVDTQLLTPSSPETITDSAEIEALDESGDVFDPVETAVEPSLEAEARYAATGIWDFAPRQPDLPTAETLEDVYFGSFEVSQQTHDAIALPLAEGFANDVALAQQFDPLPAGTTLEFDERGLVVATQEGTLSPEWVMVYAGKPAVVPASFPTRTVVEAPTVETAPNPALAQLAAFRPQPRPGDLIEQNERATLGGSTLSELASLRPRLRPEDPALEAAAAVVASLDPADLEGATQQAVVASLRPSIRPQGFEAKAAKIQEQLASVPVPAAQVSTPSIPSSASVARSATQNNAINLRKVNLIGVYGTTSDRRALVRLATGRYRKVKVGDRLDGGRVSAIGESELRYVKGSRSIVLAMPKG